MANRKPLNLFTSVDSDPALMEARREKLRLWSRDPMGFLHGTDVDGTPMIITQDEQDDTKAFKPFPTDEQMPHCRLLCNELLRPVKVATEAEISLVDKSRRMMVSTQTLLLGYWFCLFKKGRKCLAPDTLILGRDLQWHEAGSLVEGQQLIAFDEEPIDPVRAMRGRNWRLSIVERIGTIEQPCVRLNLMDGTSVICSKEHMWLSRVSGEYGGYRVRWRKAQDMKRDGSRFSTAILRLLSTWKFANDYESGYVAGVLDGEGSIFGTQLTYGQVAGPAYDRFVSSLRSMGYHFTEGSRPVSQDVPNGLRLALVSTRSEMMRLLGQTRPVRLLENFSPDSLGSLVAQGQGSVFDQTDEKWVRVHSVEDVGVREVVTIQTSTGTLIADGLASHNCFLSKQTQELAEMLLMDKVRSTHLRTPQWFQEAMPFTMEPAAIAKATATGSEFICVSQSAAVRHFRGNAASILIVDESAVQEQYGEMMQAANSMSQRIWALSSAYRGNPGADVWNALTEEPPAPGTVIEELLPNRMYDRPAMTARTTAKGYRVITLEAWAIPARQEAWLMRAEQRSASHADFQREVLRNKNVTSGTSVFPEFSKIGREKYIYEPKELLAGPVIRGWDGGQRAPACTWMQYSPKSDRVFVLREFTPRSIASHHFRDVSMYLSGQLLKADLEPECLEWVDALDGWPGIPKAPWFAPGTTFIDLSGPEYNATQSIASKDPNEATQRQVWEARGIQLSIQSGPVKARVMVLRRLLSLRPDGYPGILIAPCCIDVLAMLDGGLTYKKQTTHNPAPEEIRKDGRFDNIFDSLTYPIVGIVPAVGVPGVTAPKEYGLQTEEAIGWSL